MAPAKGAAILGASILATVFAGAAHIIPTELEGEASPDCHVSTTFTLLEGKKIDEQYACENGKLKNIWLKTDNGTYLVSLKEPVSWDSDNNPLKGNKPSEQEQQVKIQFKSAMLDGVINSAVWGFVKTTDPESYPYTYSDTYGTTKLEVPVSSISKPAP